MSFKFYFAIVVTTLKTRYMVFKLASALKFILAKIVSVTIFYALLLSGILTFTTEVFD